MRKYLFIFLLTSCSLFQGEVKQPFPDYKIEENPLHSRVDYIDHLASLADQYLKSPGVKKIRLNKASREYFNRRYSEIVASNELLLNNKNVDPKFYVIKEKTPFYFSLPGGSFFFSLGLLKKYLRNEELLIAVLTHEIIKVHRNIYKRKIIIPVGYLRTERMLSLTDLDLEDRIELDKWTYFAMRRAGFDPSAYLMWLQTQNRNILDFAVQWGSSRKISREEFIFKNFVAEQGSSNKTGFIREEKNSSKRFYYLLNHLNKFTL